jgi:hypothetical protein
LTGTEGKGQTAKNRPARLSNRGRRMGRGVKDREEKKKDQKRTTAVGARELFLFPSLPFYTSGSTAERLLLRETGVSNL